jgi:hypothetical protein
MVKRRSVVLALGGISLAAAAAAGAQEAESPDLEFLEYLGSWQADDDEWLAVAEWEKDALRPRDEDEDEKRHEDAERAKPDRDGKDDDNDDQ